MIFLREHEMSVRVNERGGPVSREVELGAGETPLAKRCLVILVHGFCNDLSDARASYATFLLNCLKKGGFAASRKADLFRFFWPGDKDWGWLRFASYTWEIGPAKQSAEVLYRFLTNLPNVLDLYLIAHSLGNRLVLELFNLFVQRGQPAGIQLKGICMMAAAVPVAYVDLAGSLQQATTLTRTHVLFSPSDTVLAGGFPLGEIPETHALWSEAVGLNGNPGSSWDLQKLMCKGRDKGYGHGDYWTQPETEDPVSSFLKDPAATSTLIKRQATRTLPPPNQPPMKILAKYRTPVRFLG
jgi:hypothetical protein